MSFATVLSRRIGTILAATACGVALVLSPVAPVANAESSSSSNTGAQEGSASKQCADVSVEDKLLWNYKDSFITHIKSFALASGTVTANDGAGFTEELGPMSFTYDPSRSHIDDKDTGELAFNGTIHMTAYPGLGEAKADGTKGFGFDGTFTDVRIKVDQGHGTLVLDYDVPTMESGRVITGMLHKEDVVFANLEVSKVDLSDPEHPVIEAKALMAEDGVPFSAGKYEVGTELSPVSLNVGRCAPERGFGAMISNATRSPWGLAAMIIAGVAGLGAAIVGLINAVNPQLLAQLPRF